MYDIEFIICMNYFIYLKYYSYYFKAITIYYN